MATHEKLERIPAKHTQFIIRLQSVSFRRPTYRYKVALYSRVIGEDISGGTLWVPQNAVLPVLTLFNMPTSAIFSIKPNSE